MAKENRMPKRIALADGREVYVPWYGSIVNPAFAGERRCVYVATMIRRKKSDDGEDEERPIGSFFWLSADERLERFVYKDSDEMNEFVDKVMLEIGEEEEFETVMVFGKAERKLAVEGTEKARFTIDPATHGRTRIALKGSSRIGRSSI